MFFTCQVANQPRSVMCLLQTVRDQEIRTELCLRRVSSMVSRVDALSRTLQSSVVGVCVCMCSSCRQLQLGFRVFGSTSVWSRCGCKSGNGVCVCGSKSIWLCLHLVDRWWYDHHSLSLHVACVQIYEMTRMVTLLQCIGSFAVLCWARVDDSQEPPIATGAQK
jgi:hypothetical protein